MSAASLPATPARSRFPVAPRTLFAIGIALAAAGAGVWWIASPKAVVSTDDAYLAADTTTVAPRVRGFVSAVLVRDNQAVKAGDALVRIDPEEFDARVASAQAELGAAEAAVQAAHSALATQEAEVRLADAGVAEARTVIGARDAQSARADADRRRYDALVADGAVSRRDADALRAAAVTSASDAAGGRAAVLVSEGRTGVARARLDDQRAALAQAQAIVTQKRAALKLAEQDQGHALIRTPIDGVVGARTAQQGDFVQPGTRLMTVVPLNALYVVANFKETQTARMAAGDEATIRVDALGGARIFGRVDSFAPGSGSQFSLLPFEPGTGNFTKIVQRIPVRIRLAAGQPDLLRLRPGLSVTAAVRTMKGSSSNRP